MTTTIERSAWVHPELKSGEVLLRNMTQAEFTALDYETKRRGMSAYDGEGNPIAHADWLPVFLHAKEVDARGIDLQLARKLAHWDNNS